MKKNPLILGLKKKYKYFVFKLASARRS